MTIGASLFLIIVGAILRFAVTAHLASIDLKVVGLILMIGGVLGLIIGLWLTFAAGARSRQPTPRPPQDPPAY